MTIHPINVKPFAIARVLGAIALLLLLASIASQLIQHKLGYNYAYGLVPLFYADAEQNIPALFSVLLLFCAALLLAAITVIKKKEQDPDTLRWAILALGFLLMAIDEATSIHEKLVIPIRALLGGGRLGFLYFAWVIPGMALITVVGVFFLGFLLRLPAKTRFTFMFAAALFIGGIIGFELVGGRYAEMHGRDNLTYGMIATAEEGLEIFGMIVFIYALLRYIAENYHEVRFQILGTEKNVRSKIT